MAKTDIFAVITLTPQLFGAQLQRKVDATYRAAPAGPHAVDEDRLL